jgi:hypothetical protein
MTTVTASELYRYQQNVLKQKRLTSKNINRPIPIQAPTSTFPKNKFIFTEILPKGNQTIMPNLVDVKCGQDKRYQNHYGNKKMREYIEANAQRYQVSRASKKAASIILGDIVNVMKNIHGSRFLRFDKGTETWKNLDEDKAREKVSHAMRTYIRDHL